jgi:hypothetical protein
MAELVTMFGNHLTDLLGWPAGKVREAYRADPVGSQLYDDVCYYYVQAAEDPINRQVERIYRDKGGTAGIVNRYTRVLELRLIFYGKTGYDKATLLRLDLLEPERNAKLFANGVRVVTDIGEPRLIWEEYRGQWLPRTDMSARFNQEVTDERREAAYLSGAEIVVVAEQEERTVEI